MILDRYNTVPSAILLDLFCQWAKDNPTADENDFVREVLPKLGMAERTTGYTVWGALPKTSMNPRAGMADDAGTVVGSFGPVNDDNGEYKLTPTNSGKLLSFDGDRVDPRETNGSSSPTAVIDKWGIKTAPLSFQPGMAFGPLNATFGEIRSRHALAAILSVAGIRVPLFAGTTGASGCLVMAEPQSSVWKLEKISPDGANPEWKTSKLVPSEGWTDLKAYSAGFESGAYVQGVCDSNAITCWATRCVHDQLLDKDRYGLRPVQYHAAPTWESGSETREPDRKMGPGPGYNPTLTLPEPVLLLAVRAMLQWARGLRRSCDGIIPVAGKEGAEIRMPSSPYYDMPDGIYGRWPVRELACARTDLGDTNHLVVGKLITDCALMKVSGWMTYENRYHQNGKQTDNEFFDAQLKRASNESSLFQEVPCKVTLYKNGGGVAIAPFGSGLIEKDDSASRFDVSSAAENLEFAKFRYRTARAIAENLGTNRRPFKFVSYGNRPAQDTWHIPPDSQAITIFMIESALSRFSTYAS